MASYYQLIQWLEQCPNLPIRAVAMIDRMSVCMLIG